MQCPILKVDYGIVIPNYLGISYISVVSSIIASLKTEKVSKNIIEDYLTELSL